MLDLDQAADYIFDRHRTDLLRVQVLDRYDVDSDGDDYERYLRGEPAPAAPGKQAWLAHLRGLVADGRQWRVVHVIDSDRPLTPYLRYQCEWGYLPNVAAGQQVRILAVPAMKLMTVHVGDFFVIEHRDVLHMHYVAGRFIGAEPVERPDAALSRRNVAELLWHKAVPFTEWWADHPQYHRDTVHAA